MSIQFGRWNVDGKPADREYFDKAESLIATYGPDHASHYFNDNVGIVYRAFCTTKESWNEIQPRILPSGSVLTWDGRLDNRSELMGMLNGVQRLNATDVDIVSAAYDKWGPDCFSNLIGDWTLSIWDSNTRSLTLAKDAIGTRHLYFSYDEHHVTWSSILDPLVLLAEETFSLCEEYVAGWFAFFPPAHLTPYVGIHSVPPSSFVLIGEGKLKVTKYWNFDGSKRIRYSSDGEYEEHFRSVFAQSVCRRLRSDSPVLAELSGGMDSSSIVCMADSVITHGSAETPRLDTLSYFNDSEPNWNERPYFTKVEEKRGRTGCHIDVSPQEFHTFLSDRFASTPGHVPRPRKADELFAASLTSHANRVLLSGIGGDEVMGGIPAPTLELADLLATARFRTLAHQLKVWALSKRKPWFHLLFEVFGAFCPVAVSASRCDQIKPWLTADFLSRNRVALQGYERRLNLLGALPSFQSAMTTLDALRRQLACVALPSGPLYETRYPYLDRTLLEFIFAIPRDQLLRPGQRRSLMRRALVGIVPDKLLNRRRKAFVYRSPRAAITSEWRRLKNQPLLASSLGVIKIPELNAALEGTRGPQTVPVVPLLRALAFETWLRSLQHSQVVLDALNTAARFVPRSTVDELPLGLGANKFLS